MDEIEMLYPLPPTTVYKIVMLLLYFTTVVALDGGFFSRPLWTLYGLDFILIKPLLIISLSLFLICKYNYFF